MIPTMMIRRHRWILSCSTPFSTLIFRLVVDGDDPHPFALADGLVGFGVPELAVDEDLAGRREVGPGRPDLPDHALPAR